MDLRNRQIARAYPEQRLGPRKVHTVYSSGELGRRLDRCTGRVSRVDLDLVGAVGCHLTGRFPTVPDVGLRAGIYGLSVGPNGISCLIDDRD